MSEEKTAMDKYLKQQQQLFGNLLFVDRKMLQPETPEITETESTANPSLEEYKQSIQDCTLCDLSSTRTQFVFGAGSPDADLVFVGEAPGEQEDKTGIPFVGRAGKLLDKILAAIDLSREDVFICNVLKCRPPKNRDPLAGEIELCEPYLKTQLEIIKPRVIVALGRIAARTLLRVDEPLGKMRERTFLYHGIDTLVTYHPAALLRNPNLKKPAWEDFQNIRDNYLKGNG